MGAQEALSVAHDQDGLIADRQNEVIARLANLAGMPGEEPVGVESPDVLLEQPRVHVNSRERLCFGRVQVSG